MTDTGHMRAFLPRWLGGLGGSKPAAWPLHDYPPFPLPHPGCGAALSLAQAEANLAAFTTTLAERQLALRDWLAQHHGPDASQLAPVDYATALQHWAREHWARLPAFARLPAHAPWPDGGMTGHFIVNSLLADLAASLGEAIRRGQPAWRWGLNLDAADLADGMATARRVVLLADLAEPTPETAEAVLDPAAPVFAAHRFPGSVDFRLLDSWAEMVRGALAAGGLRPAPAAADPNCGRS